MGRLLRSREAVEGAIEGGVPVALADATEGVGAAWGEDDNIYFSPRSTSGVMRIPASGGASEALTVPERKAVPSRIEWCRFCQVHAL